MARSLEPCIYRVTVRYKHYCSESKTRCVTAADCCICLKAIDPLIARDTHGAPAPQPIPPAPDEVAWLHSLGIPCNG